MFFRALLHRKSAYKPVRWESLLQKKFPEMPHMGNRYFKLIGSQIVKDNAFKDAGRAAFDDCLSARRQTELILHSIGYNLDVVFYGGIVLLGFFEVSSDLDMAAIGDVELSHEEAALVVQNISKEFRQIGLRPMAIPRAFIPIIRCDRTVNIQPSHTASGEDRTVSFTFRRALTLHECDSFTIHLVTLYGSKIQSKWMKNLQSAHVTFETTNDALHAMANTKVHCNVDCTMRQPASSRDGPELYRFPFDICFHSMGPQNTFMMRKALLAYPGARHLLLALRKWGKRCKNIHSTEGFLASYCFAVMLVHFLIQAERIQPINPDEEFIEPQLLPKEPTYVPLRQRDIDVEDIGYLYFHFINYYAHIFNSKDDVVNVTSKSMQKEQLGWIKSSSNNDHRPPFFSLGIKDVIGNENCARIVDVHRAEIIHQNFQLASHVLNTEVNDPLFAIQHLSEDAPRAEQKDSIHKLMRAESVRLDLIKKKITESHKSKERFGTQLMADSKMKSISNAITNSVLLWMKKEHNEGIKR